MSKMLSLLVGVHFRPPAKALVAHLPAGAPVYLQPEPGNQYDENAIQVLFDGAELPKIEDEEARNARETDFLSQGFSEEEIRDNPEMWHLGYIAKTGGKPLAGKPWAGNVEVKKALQKGDGEIREYTASLAFGPAGEALVSITIQEE